jgi:hypothetical protein
MKAFGESYEALQNYSLEDVEGMHYYLDLQEDHDASVRIEEPKGR